MTPERIRQTGQELYTRLFEFWEGLGIDLPDVADTEKKRYPTKQGFQVRIDPKSVSLYWPFSPAVLAELDLPEDIAATFNDCRTALLPTLGPDPVRDEAWGLIARWIGESSEQSHEKNEVLERFLGWIDLFHQNRRNVVGWNIEVENQKLKRHFLINRKKELKVADLFWKAYVSLRRGVDKVRFVQIKFDGTEVQYLTERQTILNTHEGNRLLAGADLTGIRRIIRLERIFEAREGGLQGATYYHIDGVETGGRGVIKRDFGKEDLTPLQIKEKLDNLQLV